MPNILGGDSTHPAYMPRRLTSREVLIGDSLYSIVGNGRKMRVSFENVNGSCWSCSANDSSLPVQVQARVRLLKKAWMGR
ncbi:MAG: hypothetical protein G01um101420_470 [Parcubacteria group bacterium Gr01-1014_20]|nr:MAG: hypothetical protein G01um101420_470 [Parcubacteria group bacterium Gr01-1014_20]